MQNKKTLQKSLSKPTPISGDGFLTHSSSLGWLQELSALPSLPGVYWFSDKKGTVLYVGKAKNLKNRVSSYTRINQLRGKTDLLVQTAHTLKWKSLESELEALLVEAELIRTHLPEFNILLKDDKSPLYINITNDAFPLVKTVRKKDVDTQKVTGTVLGPFPSGYKVKEVLKLIRPIFKWCTHPIQNKSKQASSKPCFYYHLDMCNGACIDQISQQDYQQQIQELTLFLRGKKKQVIKDITTRMKQAASLQHFEQAARLRDQIALIASVTSYQYTLKPDLVLPQLRETKIEEGLVQLRKIISEHFKLPRTIPLQRIEGYDVSNIQGTSAAVAMVTFVNGRSNASQYRLFNIRSIDTPNDYHMLKEAILRRQNHPKWGKPDLLIIDGGKGQLRAALSVWKWDCPVISIAKNPDRIIMPTVVEFDTKTKKQKVEYTILTLPPTHPALQLVQAVRDESHRFSKKQHHSLRKKQLLP